MPAVLVLVVGVVAYERARTLVQDVGEVERSHAIIERSDALLKRAIDAETGQRAYLLTGDTVFLQPYNGALVDVQRALDSLRPLLRDEPSQLARLDSAVPIIAGRFALLELGVSAARRGDVGVVRDRGRLLAGKRRMDDLRAAVASLQSYERSLLAERHAAEQRSVRSASLVVGSAAILALLLSGLINLAFSRAIKDLDAANIRLTEVNEDLERQSQQLEMQAVEMESQAAELEATAEDLRSTNDTLSHRERGAQLLNEASKALSSTLDYEKTLQSVAKLAVGYLADWCGVDLADEHGGVRQVVVAHKDESRVRWARELNKRYPPDYEAPTGVGEVIRSGRAAIYPEIPDEMLVSSARDDAHLEILRELQIRSALIVPMIARGRTLGALTLISSDTGRHYGEADQNLAQELATRAAIAIDNARLYRGALAASEAKSAFLATISHELRTPLNAIIGYASLLEEGIDGTLSSGQQAQLGRIRSSANHLLALIDEVLTFSRVEAGKEVVRADEVELKPLVAQALSMISPVAAEKGLELRDQSENATLVTDEGKLRQILLNLLSNAIKFSDGGEITISSELQEDSISISIADSGIGIAPENLERIFDPFWQVEQRSTRRVGGTGLGLSVSRNLARLLGGDVSVESQAERGSTFTVTLPKRLQTA